MEKETRIPLQDTLLPALMQCFGIMFLGYVLGKTKMLRPVEAKGLSIFVQYLSLPALIFSTVSTISFTQIKWEFIASVFVAKTCIFICVALVTILLTHPLNLGKAGIYAIAATQSNDFALGYPLILSLYQNTHSEFPTYLYIIAPIQLLILNGIGFFFLEVEKQNQRNITHKNSNWFHIFKEIFKNPVIIATIIGLLWNVILGENISPFLSYILKAFSSAFPATALLLLGYTMNLRNKGSSNISLSVALIILAKNLILPLLLQRFITFLLQNSTRAEIQAFSSFGFLYGTIPTAPTAYVFATQYESCVNAIAKTVIYSTLVSAPVMFSTASVISLNQIGVKNISFYLNSTIGYLSAINAFCCIWLLMLLCLGKRWRNINFTVIIFLVFTQLSISTGGLLLLFSPVKNSALFYVQYILTNGGIYATRMYAVLLACLLFIIRVRSLCFILHMKKKVNVLSIIFCLVLPYVLAALLIFYKNDNNSGPNYQLGYIQYIVTFILTLVTLIGTISLLIMQRIYSKKDLHNLNQYSINDQNPNRGREIEPIAPIYSESGVSGSSSRCCDIEDIGRNFRQSECCGNESEIQDHVCSAEYSCSVTRRHDCAAQVSRYINENQEIGTGINDNQHFPKHIGLLIALIVSMTLSLSICFWKLLMEAVNGVFIELEFLDVIVNYSLGISFFIIFGFDKSLINIVHTKWKIYLNKLLPNEIDDINQNSTSEQFIIHYFERCRREIVGKKVKCNVQYHNVFEYNSIIEWILKERLVSTVEEAKCYVKCLLEDHIIEKVYENENFFKYLNLLRFTEIHGTLNE